MDESDDNVSSPARGGGEWTDEEMESAEPMPIPEIDDDEADDDPDDDDPDDDEATSDGE